jgi:hypothetical protein
VAALTGPAGGLLNTPLLVRIRGFANCITANARGSSCDGATTIPGQPAMGVRSQSPVNLQPWRIEALCLYST